MPKVSVIVPCYNVEHYIERSMNALVNQTLHDIEIICIDDKSTDNTLSKLQGFAAKDSRIKLFVQKENQGVAVARNIGLKNATGEYIGFVDPDDYVDLDFYQKLYECAVQTGADVVQGDVWMTNSNNGTTCRHWIRSALSKGMVNFSSAFWSAIYKSELIKDNNISFPPEIRTSQDSVFLTQIVLSATSLAMVDGTYYHYFFQRPDSLDSAFLSHDKAVSKYNAFVTNFDLILKANLPKAEFAEHVWHHVVRHIMYEIRKTYECEADHKQMFDLLCRIRNGYGIKRYIDRRLPKKIRKHIKTNDFQKFKAYLVVRRRRFYLFGIVPVVRIDRFDTMVGVNLFDLFNLIVIQDNKVKLFGCILLLKIKG